MPERVITYFPFFSPLCERLRLAKGCRVQGIPPIARLLGSGRPLKVTSFVVPVDIDTVKTVSGTRTLTHFCKKLLKRVKAELDAPTAIAWIFGIHRVVASCLRFLVSAVGRRNNVAGGVSVSGVSPSRFLSQTPTRTGGANVASGNCCAITAFTQAMPVRSFSSDASKANNEQFPQTLSCKDLQRWTNAFGIRVYGKVIISHWNKVHSFVNLVRVGKSLNHSCQPVSILA